MVLPRPRTVTVHIPSELGPVNRTEFTAAVLEVVRKNDVKCIQDMRGYFRVTFKSEDVRDEFTAAGISIRGFTIFAQQADESRLVKLYQIPFEVPEGEIKTILGKYGIVLSHSFDIDRATGINTGTRSVRMRILRAIPDRLVVLNYPFIVWYPDQPKTCRVCRAEGHIASRCPNKGLCRICRQPGHMANTCPDKNTRDASNPWRVIREPEQPRVEPDPLAAPEPSVAPEQLSVSNDAALESESAPGIDAQEATTSGGPTAEVASLLADQPTVESNKDSEMSEDFQIPQNVLDRLSKSVEDGDPDVAPRPASASSPVELAQASSEVLIAAKSAAVESQIDLEMSEAFDKSQAGICEEAESDNVSLHSMSEDEFGSSEETFDEQRSHQQTLVNKRPVSETIEVLDSGHARLAENLECGQTWGDMFDEVLDHLTSEKTLLRSPSDSPPGRAKIPRLQ